MSGPVDNVVPLRRDAHQEAILLLPWYAAGGLDEREHAQVAAHLADCAPCRAELAFERRLAAEIAALPADAEPAWPAMALRLDAPARRKTRTASTRPTVRTAKAVLPWLGWLLAAEALLVVGLQAVTPPRSPSPPAVVYHTLAGPADRPPADIAVIFRPQTTEGQIRAILDANHARLADGPTAANAWMLGVPIEERDAALRRLRNRPEVLTAEPIDPVGP